jgi:dTDP-glucose 4,6-dehydratase
MKKILVTGGAGFIGSAFVRYFLAAHPGARVVNLDKLTYAGNLRNLEEVGEHPGYEFVRGDVTDPLAVARAMKGADAVLNFAAETHVDRSIQDPSSFVKTNCLGVYQLLEKARETAVPRFIQISTDEVYGSIAEGSFREESSLRPSSPYSASKAAGDLLAQSYYVTYKCPVIIVRSVNNFGPFQYPEKVIPLFITNLIEGKKVPLYAKGDNVRDWIHVEDNCRAIDLVLAKGVAGETYNVAAGNELTNIELTRRILRAFGRGEEAIERVPDRPGHDYRYSCDASKIRRLGFAPRFAFDEALEQTIDWYRRREDWWRPLKTDAFTLK